MHRGKNFAQAVVLFLAVLASGIAHAQTSNGTLAGSVTDPTGAVVAKATVAVVSSLYGQPHETHTDSVGTYRLESLQPGVYDVTFTAPGFEALTVKGAVVNGSLTTTIDGKLKLAAAQQTIEVTAPAAQAIDTQSGQLGETVSRQEVAELPYGNVIAGRPGNAAELALTLPGVQDSPVGNGAIAPDAATEGVSFSVNGTRPRANNFLIDGQDDNDYALTGQAYQPYNYGAIQEVTILTNSYSAEYGRGGGSVTNYIYKSGTNNFHGDLWEVNRNSALAAIPAQDAVVNPISKNPYDNENTFGFDAGGPVIKDKLFAFGAAQWDRERQLVTGPAGFNLPTAAGIATLQSLLPNPNISLFLKAIGSLESPFTTGQPGVMDVALGSGRPNVEVGPFQFNNIRTVSNAYDWNYRMDWQLTDHDTLTGSIIRDHFTLSPDSFANPNALPNFQTQQELRSEIVRGQWVRTDLPVARQRIAPLLYERQVAVRFGPGHGVGRAVEYPVHPIRQRHQFSLDRRGEFLSTVEVSRYLASPGSGELRGQPAHRQGGSGRHGSQPPGQSWAEHTRRDYLQFWRRWVYISWQFH